MEIVLLTARLFLAAILVIAGVAKAADSAGTRNALIGFGVSARLSAPMGWLLPAVEIGVATVLIPLNTAWIGGICALVLMMIFSAAISVSLLRGRTTECNCFGQLHSKPVSWSMFLRNLFLAAVAALIVAQGKASPGLSAVAWFDEMKTGEVVNLLVSSLAAGLLIATVMYLRRVLSQQARILDRIDAIDGLLEEYAPKPVEREDATPPLEGLPVGAPAPDFVLASVGGGQISLQDLLDNQKSVLLLFVSPNCAPCATLLQDVRGWQREYSDRLTIALLSKGSLLDNERRVAKYGAAHLLLLGESGVADIYEAKWTPAAVLIGPQGRIASNNAYGDEAIRKLIAAGARANGFESGNAGLGSNNGLEISLGTSSLKVGDPAPEFLLQDTDGEPVSMIDLSGRATLLLFWSPSCPYCTEMSDQIRRWEEDPPPGAPRLVFVSSGDLEQVKKDSESFESLFLHDDGFQLGSMLGTKSTPSALLIDSEGRIASSIATGSANVMLLAGVRNAGAHAESGH